MKKKLLVVALLLAAFMKAEAQPWNLVWSDEFTSGPVNPANWVFETGGGGWGNNELEYYTNRPENATVHNNNLLIIARKESFSGSNYTSARMITRGLHAWTYGKIEARIKLQHGKGLWPAFWMLGQNIGQAGWPKCGEIDIMEHVNSNPETNGTIHWDNNGHAQYGGDTAVNSTQYHVYAVEWDANAIKWLLDGKKYWEANIANNINSTDEFHNPFFILFNFAVGGTWPGNPDGTTVFPDTMFVDYVRVYQKSVTPVKENIYQGNSSTIITDASGNVTLCIQDPEHGKYDVQVMDISGRRCFQNDFFHTGSGRIETPLLQYHFRPGIYFVAVGINGKTTYLKFVKE